MRESPAFELLDRFQALGAEVAYLDPHVPEIGPTREHAKWQRKKSVAWSVENLQSLDAVVISTHHKAYDLHEMATAADLIIDTRNAMSAIAGGRCVCKSLKSVPVRCPVLVMGLSAFAGRHDPRISVFLGIWEP